MENKKKYWDKYSHTYGYVWTKSKGKQILAELEDGFIRTNIDQNTSKFKSIRYLDIGVGAGRTIQTVFSANIKISSILGIDISSDMIKNCKRIFKNRKNISFREFNIEEDWLTDTQKFNLCTCIRVLKYTENVDKIVKNINKSMEKGGIFIFTITNKHSIAYFDILRIKHYKHSRGDITAILRENGFEPINVCGFQKIPEFVYRLLGNSPAITLLFKLEKRLSLIFSDTFLARNIYIAAKKK